MGDTRKTIWAPVRAAKLRRAVYWSLLGAAAGVVAAFLSEFFVDVLVTVFKSEIRYIAGKVFVPGLLFGLVIGEALRRRRLARWPQIAALAVVSVGAWYAAVWVGFETFFELRLNLRILGSRPTDPPGVIQAAEFGLIWSTMQTAGFAAAFSFTRRSLFWAVWPIAGTCTASLLLIGFELDELAEDPVALGILWTGWYAACAATLSAVLPGGPTAPG